MTRSETLDTNLRYIQIIRNRKQRKDLCSNILFTSESGVTKPHPSGQASDIPRTFRLLDMIFFLKKGYEIFTPKIMQEITKGYSLRQI
jgi:hypothetical protein